MECVLCGKDSKYRTVKGHALCRECTEDVRKIRNHLNSTRKNPRHNLNPSGDPPATTLQVIETGIQKKKKLDEVSNETV